LITFLTTSTMSKR